MKKIIFSLSLLFVSFSSKAEVTLDALEQDLRHVKRLDLTPYSASYGKMALMSGWIENLRLLGFFQTKIDDKNTEQVVRREFKDDQPLDEMSAVIKDFFRSQSGQLSVTDQPPDDFVTHLDVTSLVTLLQWVRSQRDVLVPLPLQKGEKIETFFFNRLVSPLKGASTWKQAVKYDQKSPSDKKKKDKNLRSSISRVLQHIQKALLEEKSGQIYPLFTIESILTAFFVKKFSDSDLKAWHEAWAAADPEAFSVNPEVSQRSSLEDLRKLVSLEIQKIRDSRMEAPYGIGTSLIQNGPARAFDRSQGRFLENQTLADCTETALRHFFNLAFYRHFPEGSGDASLLKKGFFDFSSLIKHTTLEPPERTKLEAFFSSIQPPELSNESRSSLRDAWISIVGDWKSLRYNSSLDLDTGFKNGVKAISQVAGIPLSPEEDFRREKEETLSEEEQAKRWVLHQLQHLTERLSPWKKWAFHFSKANLNALRHSSEKELYGTLVVQVTSVEDLKAVPFQFDIEFSPSHASLYRFIPLATGQKTRQDTEDKISELRDSLFAQNSKNSENSILQNNFLFFFQAGFNFELNRMNLLPLSGKLFLQKQFIFRDAGTTQNWIRFFTDSILNEFEAENASSTPVLNHKFVWLKNRLEATTFIPGDERLNQEILEKWFELRRLLFRENKQEVLKRLIHPVLEQQKTWEERNFVSDWRLSFAERVSVSEKLLIDLEDLSGLESLSVEWFDFSSTDKKENIFFEMERYLEKLVSFFDKRNHLRSITFLKSSLWKDFATVVDFEWKEESYQQITLDRAALQNFWKAVQKTAWILGGRELKVPTQPDWQALLGAKNLEEIEKIFLEWTPGGDRQVHDVRFGLDLSLFAFEKLPQLKEFNFCGFDEYHLSVKNYSFFELFKQKKSFSPFGHSSNCFVLSSTKKEHLKALLSQGFFLDQESTKGENFLAKNIQLLLKREGVLHPEKLVEVCLGQHGRLETLEGMELLSGLRHLNIGLSYPDSVEGWKSFFRLFDRLPLLERLEFSKQDFLLLPPEALKQWFSRNDYFVEKRKITHEAEVFYSLSRDQFNQHRTFLLEQDWDKHFTEMSLNLQELDLQRLRLMQGLKKIQLTDYRGLQANRAFFEKSLALFEQHPQLEEIMYQDSDSRGQKPTIHQAYWPLVIDFEPGKSAEGWRNPGISTRFKLLRGGVAALKSFLETHWLILTTGQDKTVETFEAWISTFVSDPLFPKNKVEVLKVEVAWGDVHQVKQVQGLEAFSALKELDLKVHLGESRYSDFQPKIVLPFFDFFDSNQNLQKIVLQDLNLPWGFLDPLPGHESARGTLTLTRDNYRQLRVFFEAKEKPAH